MHQYLAISSFFIPANRPYIRQYKRSYPPIESGTFEKIPKIENNTDWVECIKTRCSENISKRRNVGRTDGRRRRAIRRIDFGMDINR